MTQPQEFPRPLVLPEACQGIEQEVGNVRNALEAERQHEMRDLASENERQTHIIQSYEADPQRMVGVKAAAEGRAGQSDNELSAARRDAVEVLCATEALRTTLARAELRLERMLEIDAKLSAMRIALLGERQLRGEDEKAAAVALAQKYDQDERIVDLKDQIRGLALQIVKA